jgi:hypothetical protein
MCANGGESNKETRAFALQTLNFTQYIYRNQTVIRGASYIKCFEKEAYIWVSGFCPHGESKKKTNARVLEDIMSCLSNNTGPSNSIQQWGLKSLEKKLVKGEIISYNEG